MTDAERELAIFHVVFAVVTVPPLLLAPQGRTGAVLLAAVVLYHAATVVVTRWRGHREWAATWRFAAVLSPLMVLPDAVLVEGLGVLRFPPDGVPDVLGVTLPMVGLWAIPVILIVTAADAVTRRTGEAGGVVAALVVTALVFGGAETTLTLLPVWEPVAVTTVGGFAPYILPAELVLGLLAVAGARYCRGTGPVVHLTVAAMVALAYTGAATVSWLLIEGHLLA